MTPTPMTLTELECYFCCLKPKSCNTEKYHTELDVNWKAHVACNLNCLIDSEGLLKVTGSHVHCGSGNFLETVQDRDVQTTNRK